LGILVDPQALPVGHFRVVEDRPRNGYRRIARDFESAWSVHHNRRNQDLFARRILLLPAIQSLPCLVTVRHPSINNECGDSDNDAMSLVVTDFARKSELTSIR
jgi:hypothetical protein